MGALRWNLSANHLHIEALPRAVSFSRDTAVRVDAGGGDVELAGDETAQPEQIGKLRRRWIVIVEIADQADSDAMLVVVLVRRFAMGAMLLFDPARADFDLSVGRVGAVADDEVIAEFVPAFGAVPLVEPRGAAGIGGAVMNDDALPPVGGLLGEPTGFNDAGGSGGMRAATKPCHQEPNRQKDDRDRPSRDRQTPC